MAAETIGFFSSDATELYKADIYRALALPTNYVLHFRYPTKYIQIDILTNLDSLIDQKGIIFYVSGNDTSLREEDRKVKLFSIREVVVKDMVFGQNIDTYHFYLELGEFVDATPHAATQPTILPPRIFVSKISVELGPNKSWINRVDAVRKDFGDLPFFFIESVRHKSKKISPVYSEFDKSSSYSLRDESNYQVHVSFYDPLYGKTGLTVENASTDVALFVPPGHRVGAARDTQVFKLQTHSLPRQRLSTVSRLLGVNYATSTQTPGSADYRILLEWTVTKGLARAWQFGFLSSLAALGLSLAKLATDDLQSYTVSSANVILGFIAAIAIGVAAGRLYVVFNKK